MKPREHERAEPARRRGADCIVVSALIGVLVIAGCYWRYYPRVMETHLEVLASYASKLESLAQAGRSVPPERWGEFTYPLERARDFARIAGKRFADRGSLDRFALVLDRYAELLDELGRLGEPQAAEEVARKRSALEQAIAATRDALRRESAAA